MLEEKVLNNYQWFNAHHQPKRIGDKFDVYALTLLTSKIDVLTQRFDRLNVNAVNSCAISPTCNRCRSYDHIIMNCQDGNLFALSPMGMLYM